MEKLLICIYDCMKPLLAFPTGVMSINSLEFLFKSNTFQPDDIKLYITSLLNKFEVALQFDEEHLLLPSLLPTETELLEMTRCKNDVRVGQIHIDPVIV